MTSTGIDFIGLSTGFLAALFQSLSYLGSRWFMQRSRGTPLDLLGTSLVWMGLASIGLLKVLAGPSMPPLRAYAFEAAASIGFFMVAQAGLFMALRHSDSSRIAPLLGLKIFVLALASALFLSQPLGVWQWAAVGLSVAAVLMLNESGGRMTLPAVGALAVAIVGYSLSDLFIKRLVNALEPAGPRAAQIGVCVAYIAGLAAGLPLALRKSSLKWELWARSLPYAACWFVSMFFLYVSFDRIGVVFANIIQSTRGLMSIGLGLLVASWLGMTDLERRVPRGVFLRRLAGAAFMTAAIMLYLLDKR